MPNEKSNANIGFEKKSGMLRVFYGDISRLLIIGR